MTLEIRPGAPIYDDGFVPFVRVAKAELILVDERMVWNEGEKSFLFRTELSPGSYELESYVRPYEGGSDLLAEVTESCTAVVRITPGLTRQVLVQLWPTHGCEIVLPSN